MKVEEKAIPGQDNSPNSHQVPLEFDHGAVLGILVAQIDPSIADLQACMLPADRVFVNGQVVVIVSPDCEVDLFAELEGSDEANCVLLVQRFEEEEAFRFQGEGEELIGLVINCCVLGQVGLADLAVEDIQVVRGCLLFLAYDRPDPQPLPQAFDVHKATAPLAEAGVEDAVFFCLLGGQADPALPLEGHLLLRFPVPLELG